MILKTSEIDMLHGKLTKKLLLFTLPIALSSMVQQLFNAADTAVVGYFSDASALAAVGTNAEIIALIITVSSGLSVGVNILIAALIGRNENQKTPIAVQTAVLLSVLFGIAGVLIGQAVTAPILRLICTPEHIFRSAELYLRIYLLGYPFLLLYDFCSAILRARGNSRYPFFALVVSGTVNIGLNLFFVTVLHMDVSGVALATTVSNGLSSFLVLIRLKKEGQFRLRRHKPFISPSFIGEILKTGIPSAIQGAVFCLANIFVQASVNHFGETAIAGSTIAMNFEYFTYYIITAFGQTATTFTGQNYAAKQYARCRSILWRCLLLSVLCSSVPIFAIVLFRNPLSGLFSHDAAVIENAGVRIMCILLFEPICNLYEITAGGMRGCGHATYPAVSTMIGTCVLRIVWIYTVFQSNPTLPILYRAFPLSWVITVLLVNIGGAIIACKGKNKKKENTNQCSALTE